MAEPCRNAPPFGLPLPAAPPYCTCRFIPRKVGIDDSSLSGIDSRLRCRHRRGGARRRRRHSIRAGAGVSAGTGASCRVGRLLGDRRIDRGSIADASRPRRACALARRFGVRRGVFGRQRVGVARIPDGGRAYADDTVQRAVDGGWRVYGA